MDNWAARERVIREWADRVGLRDWEFDIREIAPDGEYGATCAIIVDRKRAILSFPWDWRWESLGPSQVQTLVHELLHCHFDHYKVLLSRVQDHFTARELALFEASLRDVVELGIDGIATAFARHGAT